MIVKVKEPLPEEYPHIRPKQVLFTFFHFAASESLTRAMVHSGAVCIAYETIQTPDGATPHPAADERDCGADGGAGGRVVLGASDGRARRAAGGRAGRAAGHSGRRRRGHGGRERCPNRRRLRRTRDYLGHQCRPPARAGRDPARECGHALLEPCEPARGAEASRPDYRRGLCHGRAHADSDSARNAPHAQNGRGAGRCIGRPRWTGGDDRAQPPTASRPMWWTGWCITP
jgi:hypothetical protein